MLRVIICGSREFTDLDLMAQALTELKAWAGTTPLTLVHGKARGADSLADSLARVVIPDVIIEPHPADWNNYGRSAGPIRNAEMVSLGADLGLAFYIEGVDSKGTNGCVALMKSAGILVKTYTQPSK